MGKNIGDVVYIEKSSVAIEDPTFLNACSLAHLKDEYCIGNMPVGDAYIILGSQFRGERHGMGLRTLLVLKSLKTQNIYVVARTDVFESRTRNLAQEEAIGNLNMIVESAYRTSLGLFEHIMGTPATQAEKNQLKAFQSCSNRVCAGLRLFS